MKNILKVFAFVAIAFGVFMVVGSVSASTAEQLQPAGATTNFESIRVGVAGQGGVTFFNGSVLNEDGPFVVADDLRVDGAIYEGKHDSHDSKPLKFADSLVPTSIDSGLSLGVWNKEWSAVYAMGGFFSHDLHVETEIHTSDINTNALSLSSWKSLPTCNSSRVGEIRYNNDNSRFFGCNDYGWQRLDN